MKAESWVDNLVQSLVETMAGSMADWMAVMMAGLKAETTVDAKVALWAEATAWRLEAVRPPKEGEMALQPDRGRLSRRQDVYRLKGHPAQREA